jgi:hypothetical protein
MAYVRVATLILGLSTLTGWVSTIPKAITLIVVADFSEPNISEAGGNIIR